MRNPALAMQIPYAEVVSSQPVMKFLLRFYKSDTAVQNLILISPFMTALEGTLVDLERVCNRASERRVPTYVVTREPGDARHQRAVDILMAHDVVELRFNQSLHAKLYVCQCAESTRSFGLVGSANLTWSSIERNIEIAVMINGRGQGRELLRELTRWGLERMRTVDGSRLVKKMDLSRR